ncbi:hypothetical protein H4Q32_002071 [Labeo rohita]|uniref:Reverse transcriptase domain-containing protein n=1 Tax=Labeo rohita TaxID=84645 RepID=A0ABQ8MKE4_LABRO|nr:hypothetical protein H4Q32_002071 [Labeo rohita]
MTKSVWNGLKAITSYKSPSTSTEANQQLADDLNEFYCRFGKQKTGLTPYTPLIVPQHSHQHPSLAPPTVYQPALKICEGDVCKVFRKQKIRKAKGPEGVSPECLKACAVQLSSIFTLIFNRSLELCIAPSCFKCSIIILVPKKSKITGLNDYRPVALTSVVKKSFERLVLAYLKDITGPLLDPLQFAYQANRSVDDAVNMGLHYILQHLDKPGTYARILFVDFSSAFNTIIPNILQNKLSQLSVPTSICQWITSFLTDKQQLVKLGKLISGTFTTSTAAFQGCVLSPLLFSLHNNLELNTLKTVEMTVDFRRDFSGLTPLTIMNSTLAAVDSFKFLGINISQDLKWVLLSCYRVSSVLFYNCLDLYISRVKKRAGNIIKDPSHQGHNLFALLPSGRRYRSLSTRTSKHKNIFSPNAISSLNS